MMGATSHFGSGVHGPGQNTLQGNGLAADSQDNDSKAAAMKHEEGRLKTTDGLQLFEQHWLPDDEPKATVVLLHGFTEHSGRYGCLAQRLAKDRFSVYAMDLRGHGRSEGERVFVRSLDQHLSDLDVLLDSVTGRQGGKRVFLFGHSMGGTLAVRFAETRQGNLEGLVLSAAAVAVGRNVFPLLRRLAWLASICCPRLRVVRLGSGFKPILTVSVASYDDLIASVKTLADLAGNPALAQMPEGMLAGMTQGQGPAGLGIDPKRPVCVLVQTDGTQFPVVAFLPVTDLNKLLAFLQPRVGQGKDVGGGVLQFGAPSQPKPSAPGPGMAMGAAQAFVKQQGNWAIVANNLAAINSAPQDPLAVTGDLNKKYLVGLRASLQNIPAQWRQMAMAGWKMAAQMGLRRMPGESDQDYALRSGLASQGLNQFIDTVNQLSQLELGLALDPTAKTVSLQFEATATPGSKLAQQFAAMQQAKTNFAGFDRPGAAATAHWVSNLSDADVAQAKSNLANVRQKTLAELSNEKLPPEQAAVATQVVNDLFDVLDKTLDTKKADGGAVLLLDPTAATLVAGGAIAEGQKLEKALKQLVEVAQKEQPALAQMIKLDAQTYENLRFHTFTMPLPDPDAAKVLGPNLEVIVALGDQSLYLAAGKNAAETLKQVIDQSKQGPKDVIPFRVALAATPILNFVQGVAKGPAQQMAGQLAAVAASSSGKDHLTLTSRPNPAGDGVRVQLELEEGAVKLIGAAVGQFGQFPGRGPAAPGPKPPAGDDPF